jgi:hypothetical protein
VFGPIGLNHGINFNKMKELHRFRQFLNENKKDELRSLIQDLTSFEYEAFADDVGVDLEDGAEMEEFIASISDQQADSLIQSINFGKYGYMAMKGLNEGAFGTKKKAALENSLTGMAKAMVEDGNLFAEYGNVTYDEEDLKDGATPEQIEAIDQIKMAVANMGGVVVYGDSGEDGTLMYKYLVDGAGLKVITKENDENNLFHSVFNP